MSAPTAESPARTEGCLVSPPGTTPSTPKPSTASRTASSHPGGATTTTPDTDAAAQTRSTARVTMVAPPNGTSAFGIAESKRSPRPAASTIATAPSTGRGYWRFANTILPVVVLITLRTTMGVSEPLRFPEHGGGEQGRDREARDQAYELNRARRTEGWFGDRAREPGLRPPPSHGRRATRRAPCRSSPRPSPRPRRSHRGAGRP